MKKLQVTKDGREWLTIAILPDDFDWTTAARTKAVLPFGRDKWMGSRLVEARLKGRKKRCSNLN